MFFKAKEAFSKAPVT